MSTKFKQLRKGKGLTQQQIADMCGKTRQAVSGWEKGAFGPEKSALFVLSNMFEIEPEKLESIIRGDEQDS